MKHVIFIVLVFLLAAQTKAQSYKPVNDKSKVKFSIKNFGVSTGGEFKGLEGSIVFDPNDPGKASFDVSIDAATVDTDIEARDNHLRKEEYFDVQKYPRISFKSEKVSTGKGSSFNVSGKLTIKGVAKEISFPFTATAKDGGYLFEGFFEINRKDFKVGGNSMVLGDAVNVSLSVFAAKN